MSLLDRLVLQGDCIEIMQTLPDDSVDLVLTDPPFGTTSLEWDKTAHVSWITEAARLSRQIWCFGPMRFWLEHGESFRAAGWKYAQEVVWEKHNGSNFHADRFRRVHEFVVHWYQGKWGDIYHQPQHTLDATPRAVRRKGRAPHWGNIGEGHYVSVDGGPRLMRSVLQIRSEHGRAVHPTQKPVDLVRPLIAYSCVPGGLVFDLFCGSGTSGIAAVREDRRFLGVEIDGRYCSLARERVERVAKDKDREGVAA